MPIEGVASSPFSELSLCTVKYSKISGVLKRRRVSFGLSSSRRWCLLHCSTGTLYYMSLSEGMTVRRNDRLLVHIIHALHLIIPLGYSREEMIMMMMFALFYLYQMTLLPQQILLRIHCIISLLLL